VGPSWRSLPGEGAYLTKWRRVNSGEVQVFTEGKTIARGRITEDRSPDYVVYTVVFTDGSAYRSRHVRTPDGIMNQYEVREP
jgi:hypothetical protein